MSPEFEYSLHAKMEQIAWCAAVSEYKSTFHLWVQHIRNHSIDRDVNHQGRKLVDENTALPSRQSRAVRVIHSGLYAPGGTFGSSDDAE